MARAISGEESAISTQQSTLCGNISLISLGLERILHQDSILAFGTCGKQRNRATHQFLHTANIFDRLRRQVRPGAGVGGGLLPAFDRLIDRLDPGLGTLTGRQMVDFLAVQEIAGADLDGVKAIEDIEFGQRQAVDATGAHGLTDQRGVEPAAAALATGVDAELLAAAADLLADLIMQFGRKRALANPGRIGFANSEPVTAPARPHAGA